MKLTPSIRLVLQVAVCLSLAGAASAANSVPVPDFPVSGGRSLFPECESRLEPRRTDCYVRGLLAEVEKSGEPATAVPRLDRRVRSGGGPLLANCHILMHEVGRTWARRHGITLETMYRHVPRSNDPGCSAGFGMGMVMHLGTELVVRPRAAVSICAALPTRFREYTCAHGSGHAFMRGYHGVLDSAIDACRSLGARLAPDCAQGAFHDYWISLSGGDGTRRRRDAVASPRVLCARYVYARPCWYRYFWERRQDARVYDQRDVAALCDGVAGVQRAGCIAGASLLLVRAAEPVDHALMCARLDAPDSMSCLRGVNVPALEGDSYAQLRLVRTCSSQPEPSRRDCYRWFGRTLNVVTGGTFGRRGCTQLRAPARGECLQGARRLREPLATFS